MSQRLIFPNLPGIFESGHFRLHLNKFHRQQQITLRYKDNTTLTFDPHDLADLQEVVARMILFVTDETCAKLPPDED